VVGEVEVGVLGGAFNTKGWSSLKRGLGRGVLWLRRGVRGAWYNDEAEDSEKKEEESGVSENSEEQDVLGLGRLAMGDSQQA